MSSIGSCILEVRPDRILAEIEGVEVGLGDCLERRRWCVRMVVLISVSDIWRTESLQSRTWSSLV